MKKILALILSIAAVFSLASFAVGANESESDPQFVSGETINIAFVLPEEYNAIKSGGVEFKYDKDAFELVEGSAKWNVSGALIKSVDEAQSTGIFAFSSDKSISGNLFTMSLKVKPEAALGDYDITASVQFNKNNSGYTEYAFDIVYSVSVVEFVEIDDATTPEDFATAVDAIDASVANEQAYADITEALAVYSALTAAEKEEASEYYDELLLKIAEYNGDAVEINESAESSSSVALSAISDAFEYISMLLEVLIRMIWF